MHVMKSVAFLGYEKKLLLVKDLKKGKFSQDFLTVEHPQRSVHCSWTVYPVASGRNHHHVRPRPLALYCIVYYTSWEIIAGISAQKGREANRKV